MLLFLNWNKFHYLLKAYPQVLFAFPIFVQTVECCLIVFTLTTAAANNKGHQDWVGININLLANFSECLAKSISLTSNVGQSSVFQRQIPKKRERKSMSKTKNAEKICNWRFENGRKAKEIAFPSFSARYIEDSTGNRLLGCWKMMASINMIYHLNDPFLGDS